MIQVRKFQPRHWENVCIRPVQISCRFGSQRNQVHSLGSKPQASLRVTTLPSGLHIPHSGGHGPTKCPLAECLPEAADPLVQQLKRVQNPAKPEGHSAPGDTSGPLALPVNSSLRGALTCHHTMKSWVGWAGDSPSSASLVQTPASSELVSIRVTARAPLPGVQASSTPTTVHTE